MNRKNILNIWFWEFLQNLLLICAFTFGREAYAAGKPLTALGFTFLLVTAGALTIRYTETAIRPGPVEYRRETLANVFFFTAAVTFFILYFSWKPGSLPIDLLMGSLTGIAAALFQARAAGETVSVRHLLALTVSFSIALAIIRLAALPLPPLQGAILINVPVSTVIVALEYTGG